MTDELNITTPEGAETLDPSLHEKIGDMNYEVVIHFAEKGSLTVRYRLRRVILHEANVKNGTTNH